MNNRKIANLVGMLGILGAGFPNIPLIGRGNPQPTPPQPKASDAETRQRIRRRLFDRHFDRLPFNAIGTVSNPIPSRQERRKLARARAAGDWIAIWPSGREKRDRRAA